MLLNYFSIMTTLTKQERENSLTKGKRKHGGKASKIVLRNPFPRYWPLLKDEEAKTIESLIQTLLVHEREKPKIPWRKLIKVPKETRKSQIKEIYDKEQISEDLHRQRKYLRLGLNSVSRALQNLSINSCLLAEDAHRNGMVSHLVILAVTRGIPVLIVPKLKKITSDILGFSTTALGIIVTDAEPYYKSLNDTVTRLSLQFPLPPYFSWIRNKTDVSPKKKIKPLDRVQRSISSVPTVETTETIIDDFFIDRAPGPSEVSSSSTAEDRSSDFIPLSSSNFDLSHKASSNQLYDDYINSILYFAPNFKRMQKRSNRCKEKEFLTI